MGRKLLAWAVVLGTGAVFAFSIAGCGGDDSEDSSSGESASVEATEPAPPTKAEYIKAADQICSDATASNEFKRMQDDTKTADKELTDAGTDPALLARAAEDVADAARDRAEIKEAGTKELKALEAPESGAAKDFLKVRLTTVKLTGEVAKTAEAYGKALDVETSQAFAAAVGKANASVAEEAKLAEKFGFKECGQITFGPDAEK